MEITWETERTVVLAGTVAKCPKCGAVVDSAGETQAARLAEIPSEVVIEATEHSPFHAQTTPSGEQRIRTISLRRKRP